MLQNKGLNSTVKDLKSTYWINLKITQFLILTRINMINLSYYCQQVPTSERKITTIG